MKNGRRKEPEPASFLGLEDDAPAIRPATPAPSPFVPGAHLIPPPPKPGQVQEDRPYLTLVERQYLLNLGYLPKHQQFSVTTLYAMCDELEFHHLRRFLDYYLVLSQSVDGRTAISMAAAISGHRGDGQNPAANLSLQLAPSAPTQPPAEVRKRGLFRR